MLGLIAPPVLAVVVIDAEGPNFWGGGGVVPGAETGRGDGGDRAGTGARASPTPKRIFGEEICDEDDGADGIFDRDEGGEENDVWEEGGKGI